jgi:hypothetical protein
MVIARTIRLVLAAALIPSAAIATPTTDETQTRAPQQQADRRASSVPEPSDIVLLAAGVAGLIIGRRGSRSRRRSD